MAQVKWGGPFTTVDRSTRVMIKGDVFGTFDGEVPAEQEHALKLALVGAVPVVFRDSETTALKLLAQLDRIADALQQQVAGQLAEIGASGTIRVVSVQLDDQSEAKLQAAMGQAGPAPAGPAPAGGSTGGGLQADLANQMANRLAASARSGGLTRGKIILLLVGIIGLIAASVVVSVFLR
jgi:hypothetical protein